MSPRKPVQNSTPESGGGTALTFLKPINGETSLKNGSLSQNGYTTNDTPPLGTFPQRVFLAGFLSLGTVSQP